jgi:hypothetical protein
MPKMTDRELLNLVNTEFSSAMGKEGGEISTERALAWKYYMSEPLGNEEDGQSSVVTSDVADIVDGIMPSLLRLFTIADNLVSFDPVGFEDVPLAEQESDYVNYIFFKKNPAFLIMYNWFFDALVQKNGIVKAWYDESERVTTETYSGLTQEQLFSLLEDDELEPVERSESYDNETGDTLHEIEVKRVTKEPQFIVENVPPEEYRISADARNLDPSKARMVGQEREITRSDLIDMGFDAEIVNRLPAENRRSDTDEKLARYDKEDEEVVSTLDRSQDLIKVREGYIRVDHEGNGRAELRQFFVAGNELLSNEPADRQPFHVICPQPLPHKHFGRATAEKVMDVQRVSTTLLRQTLDNLYQTNNPGHAVWEQGLSDNTLDDLLTRRVGGVTRFARPIAESYAPMVVPFTAGATFPMMEYFDKVKRDRTGVHSDAEGLSPDQLKHVQTSVMGQSMDMSRMKIEAIARIFAETGIKSLFQHLHELVQKHQTKKQVVRLRNEWIEVDPTAWRSRFDMTVNIGLGIGSRDANAVHLERIKQIQSEIVAGGGLNLLVTPRNLYNTAAEFVRNANLKDPALFFTDPGDQLAPPPTSEQEQLQAQQQELMQYQQQLDAQAQAQREQKMMLDYQARMAELEETSKKNADSMMIEMEKLKNDVLDMRLKYGATPAQGV